MKEAWFMQGLCKKKASRSKHRSRGREEATILLKRKENTWCPRQTPRIGISQHLSNS